MSEQPSLPSLSGVRHLTATGFVVWRGRVLLHWHRKNRLWLPFGGHIEANEDPVECVLREVEEETGIAVAIIGASPPFAGFDEPRQLPAPVTILLERAFDGRDWHEHIDLIYFVRPLSEPPATFTDPTMRWLDATALEANDPIAPLPGEPPASLPEDVRRPALEAIRRSAL